MKSKFDFNSAARPACGIAFLLCALAFVYTLLLLVGFRHYINFLPSSQWEIITLLLALILGFVCTGIFTQFLFQSTGGKTKKNLSGLFLGLAISFFFYDALAFGLGPAITSFSLTTIEKDIIGTKTYGRNSRGADDYYINTPDLPESIFARLYVTKEEFEALPLQVHMHIALKQSFLGMTIEHYTFLPTAP